MPDLGSSSMKGPLGISAVMGRVVMVESDSSTLVTSVGSAVVGVAEVEAFRPAVVLGRAEASGAGVEADDTPGVKDLWSFTALSTTRAFGS